MAGFEPVIVAFCCEYCAYTAADTAGSKRLSYPPNVKIISVPCAGRVDVIHILKAFEKGADGVFVAACLEGDCHYENGNIRASKRVKYIRNLLEETGIGGERLEMVALSAGMGARFAEVAKEITEKIRRLGPNPIKSNSENA
ncbi:MAG: hydrogenase iron-sulfur subunit [Acidobacteria bacterium]|nr:hydrogenase iron-sulfur subunit [Acidobacteriota bacterium]